MPSGCAPRSTPSSPGHRCHRPKRPPGVVRSSGDRHKLGSGWSTGVGSTSRASPSRVSGAVRPRRHRGRDPHRARPVRALRRWEWSIPWALVLTVLGIAAFRGLIDVLAHRLIPAPSLYGAEKSCRAGRHLAATAVVLAPPYRQVCGSRSVRLRRDRHDVPDADLRRRLVGQRQHRLARRPALGLRADDPRLPADHHRPVLRELPDPVRAAAAPRRPADQGLRAGRRGLGREARRTSAARPRPRRRSPASCSCGSPARSSRRPAASASAACSSSARPAPARRCSPRASRPRSTARS